MEGGRGVNPFAAIFFIIHILTLRKIILKFKPWKWVNTYIVIQQPNLVTQMAQKVSLLIKERSIR